MKRSISFLEYSAPWWIIPSLVGLLLAEKRKTPEHGTVDCKLWTHVWRESLFFSPQAGSLHCQQYRHTAPHQSWNTNIRYQYFDPLEWSKPHLVMLAMTILSGWLEWLERCFPVSYFLQDMVGAGLPVASQIIVRSSPAVTSSVLSHEWIYGGTEQQIISFQSKNYILLGE